jgi:hypothetical protein
MAIDIMKTLRKALVELQAERERISLQITAIQQVLVAGRSGSRRRPALKTQATIRGKGARKAMSAAARKAVSRRMKAYWAKRRAGALKGKGKPEE